MEYTKPASVHANFSGIGKMIIVMGLSALLPAAAIVAIVMTQDETSDATALSQEQDDSNAASADYQSQDSDAAKDETSDDKSAQGPKPPEIDTMSMQRLSEQHRVWFDDGQKIVIVDGEVCLIRGLLEVFACPQGTKEHEAVIKVFSPAALVHAALLRIGAKNGHPVKFGPYEPVTGDVIEVWVHWKDEDGTEKTVRAQEWVRNTETKEQLQHEWVFGGSGFWTDEETGERFYQAEGGELVCLSNFSTATMDLPIESTDANSGLLFEPFTERLPPRGTPVRMILRPKVKPMSDEQPDSDNDK